MTKDLSLIVTLYNRGFEIEAFLDSIYPVLRENISSFEIILCNDGSCDDTFDLMEKVKEKYKHVYILGYEKNQGRGFAVKHCQQAIHGNIVFYVDSDFHCTTPVTYLYKAYHKMIEDPSIQVLTGDRYSLGPTNKRLSLRKLYSEVYRFLVHLLFPIMKDIIDTEAGFKGFQKKNF